MRGNIIIRENCFMLSLKKMTKLSFTTSDFKSMPVSEAYSPGGPATGAVPFHQHGLILLFPRWEGFF